VKNGWLFVGGLLLVAAGALAFRAPRLGQRPMHADEAVQAARFRALWLEGRYVYDPDEYHGPTLNYATLPAVWLRAPRDFADTDEAMYRYVPVAFGVALVLAVALLADALGRPAAVGAGVLTAVSPAMLYYSRYYIHETLFVFFTFATIACGWRYVRTGRLAWCLGAGACAGLMQATKETSVLAFGAMVGPFLVALAVAAWNWARGVKPRTNRLRICWWHVALGVGTAIVMAAVWLSSFGSNPRGPLDGLLAYAPWLSRAAGESPHVQPWYFFIRMLGFWQTADGPWWSEGLILALAIAGGLAVLLPAAKRLLPDVSLPMVRWLLVYTVLLTGVYAAIPYKTRWCLLGFLHGMILLAGVGAVALIRAAPNRPLKALVALILAAGTAHLAWQAYRASYVLSADPCNPYVYAHTEPGILDLQQDVEEIARASADARRVTVKVIWHDGYYWPLPWYLRGFQRVGYWDRMPRDPTAPLVISSRVHDGALTARLEDTHLMTSYYAVRPNVLAQLWVSMDLWEKHLRRLGRL
jgi:uncharacterized protein (TIGR03663 family)